MIENNIAASVVGAMQAGIRQHSSSIAEWIKTYQTLIGAAVAFIGVSWTIYWNAKVGRKLERFKSEQMRIALLVALRAELMVIQSALNVPVLQVLIPAAGFGVQSDKRITFQKIPARLVFEKNVDKIGLLGPSLSAEIVIAYAAVAQFEANVTPSLQGEIDEDEAVTSAAHGFNVTGRAIQLIKEDLPKEVQRQLVMFPASELPLETIKDALKLRKKRMEELADARRA
jgi:hypothetical protein